MKAAENVKGKANEMDIGKKIFIYHDSKFTIISPNIEKKRPSLFETRSKLKLY